MATTKPRARKITPAQIEEICRLRMADKSTREVAALVGVNKDTVVAVFQDYRRELVVEQAASLEEHREAMIAKFEHIADQCLQRYEVALLDDKDDRAEKWINRRQAALAQVAKLRGLEVSKVELTGAGGGPVAVEWTEEIVDARALGGGK